ncbi:Hypothetical protein FKW44_001908 [Caligus rogercresseyi]|uniref:Uncharacterized protein n=1 Tax=Caligus rogercresseyi TaxID=217165 RepID=A0A7T8KJH1_CALRO|nr:Hypothetical protein FKW44_001908 [Caligus rogercresseyi]
MKQVKRSLSNQKTASPTPPKSGGEEEETLVTLDSDPLRLKKNLNGKAAPETKRKSRLGIGIKFDNMEK